MFVCILLLVFGVLGGDGKSWTVGLGEPDVSTLIAPGPPSSLVANTPIAYIPQAVFSVLYFSSNGIYTTMVLANEWSYHAFKWKGLRVSTLPRGSQRSTYFMSLPYRYSLPLLAFSGILHWLISQSPYLVRIKSYGDNPPQRVVQPSLETSFPATKLLRLGHISLSVSLDIISTSAPPLIIEPIFCLYPMSPKSARSHLISDSV